MASSFQVQLSVPEAPDQLQARAAEALNDPARAIGLRLTRRGPGELSYRPRVQFPFLLMLWHNLNGEKMTVRFAAADGGGTSVTIDGAVARGSHALAADAEHWTEAIGGAAA